MVSRKGYVLLSEIVFKTSLKIVSIDRKIKSIQPEIHEVFRGYSVDQLKIADFPLERKKHGLYCNFLNVNGFEILNTNFATTFFPPIFNYKIYPKK